jgi:hypothetical protein
MKPGYEEFAYVKRKSLIDNITKFGDMPRATDDPPIVYSRIKAHPTSQATLAIIFHNWEGKEQNKGEQLGKANMSERVK